MWNALKKKFTLNNLLNVIVVAGPIAAGYLTGRAGAVVAAVVGIAGKLAATPIDHAGNKPSE